MVVLWWLASATCRHSERRLTKVWSGSSDPQGGTWNHGQPKGTHHTQKPVGSSAPRNGHSRDGFPTVSKSDRGANDSHNASYNARDAHRPDRRHDWRSELHPRESSHFSQPDEHAGRV